MQFPNKDFHVNGFETAEPNLLILDYSRKNPIHISPLRHPPKSKQKRPTSEARLFF